MNTFKVSDTFYLNDDKFKLISGALHYFRVVPEYWQDRLEKLKAMGCNTVETIIPWNIHEPQNGVYDFEGICNIEKFIKQAQALGLYVIIRPSPYICGEWDFGGIPAWLLKNGDIRLRSCDEIYLKHVAAWYQRLFKILSPLQINFGGPIILMQIENELGYFSNDHNYLRELKNIMEHNGAVVPLFTSNGPWGEASESGSITDDGVLETLNFGSQANKHFSNFKEKHPNKPLVCMEYWIGWFDAYNEPHHQRDAKECAKTLDDILSMGHANIYVFHGGTNFGFYNGANNYDKYMPLVASYDYDAPLTEDGRMTEKYYEFQKVISKYVPLPQVEFTSEIKRKAYPDIKMDARVGLFDTLEYISTPIYSDYPIPQEKLGQNFGYTIYRSNVGRERVIKKMRLYKARDRASIFLNQNSLIKIQYDKEIGENLSFSLTECENNVIDILMDNCGRVNFHETMDYERKGIEHSVIINDHIHTGWQHYCLDFKNIADINFDLGYTEGLPSFSRFILNADELADTYIDITSFGKGCIFVNGFNIGRFWNIGPQQRLYLPAPILKLGRNEIIVFDTEGTVDNEIKFYESAAWSSIKYDEAVEND